MTKDVEHHTNTAADFLINLHPIIPAVAVSIVDWLIVTVVAIALLYLPMKLKRYIMRYFYAITAGMSLITSTIGMLAEGIERASEKGTWSQRIPWVPVVIGVVVGILFLQVTSVLVFIIYKWRSRGQETGYSLQMDELIPDEDPSDPDSDSSFSHRVYETGTSKSTKKKLINAQAEAEERLTPLQKSSLLATVGARQTESKTVQRLRRVIMIVCSVVLQQFPQGFMIGSAFANVWANDKGKDQRRAMRLALGMAIGTWISDVGETASMVIPMKKEKVSLWRIMIFVQVSCVLEMIGVIISCVLLTYVKMLLSFALAAVSGAIIFSVCSEMIPAAYEKGARLVPNVLLTVGMLAMIVLIHLFG